MPKILNATCTASGMVRAEGVDVPAAKVLSEGTKASEGALLMEQELAMYLTSSASDIKDLITRLVGIVEQVVAVASSLDSVTTVPGSASAAIAQLEALKVQLDQSKGSLK